jgi:hypothetical protein
MTCAFDPGRLVFFDISRKYVVVSGTSAQEIIARPPAGEHLGFIA